MLTIRAGYIEALRDPDLAFEFLRPAAEQQRAEARVVVAASRKTARRNNAAGGHLFGTVQRASVPNEHLSASPQRCGESR